MYKIAIIVPCYNRVDITLRCIDQLKSLSANNFCYDIIVVDDASPDKSGEIISARYPEVIVLYGDGDKWWGGSVNIGLRYALSASYDLVYLTNDDLFYDCNTLQILVDRMIISEFSQVLGSIVVESDTRKVLSSGIVLRGLLGRFQPVNYDKFLSEILQSEIKVDLLGARSLLIPVSVLKKIGIIDENRFPHNTGDFELTYRATKSGYSCYVIVSSIVYTEQNSNYIHELYKQKKYLVIFKSYFNIRYAHNISNMFHSAFAFRNFFYANLHFVYELLSHFKLCISHIVNNKRNDYEK